MKNAREAKVNADKLERQRREVARIKRQTDAFDDLPEGQILDHLKNLMMQRAYDLLWDGECNACDAILEFLPAADVRAMLNDFSDDQDASHDAKLPKSKWYDGIPPD